MISLTDLQKYAVQVGMDGQVFNECLDSSKYQADVKQELKEGYSHGFRATPSFIINDQILFGSPSFEQLSGIIDGLLKAKN